MKTTAGYKKGFRIEVEGTYMQILKDKIDRGTATQDERDCYERDGAPFVFGKKATKAIANYKEKCSLKLPDHVNFAEKELTTGSIN